MPSVSIIHFLRCHLHMLTADYWRLLLINLALYSTEQIHSWWAIWLIQIFVIYESFLSRMSQNILQVRRGPVPTNWPFCATNAFLSVRLWVAGNTQEYLLNATFSGKWKPCASAMIEEAHRDSWRLRFHLINSSLINSDITLYSSITRVGKSRQIGGGCYLSNKQNNLIHTLEVPNMNANYPTP